MWSRLNRLLLLRTKRALAPPPSVPATKGDQLPPTSEAPPSTQSAPSPPESTPRPPKVEAIPSLNAHLIALRFFEADPCNVPPLGQRTYKQHFPEAIARDIYTEITLEHPKRDRRFQNPAVYQLKAPDGEVVGGRVENLYTCGEQGPSTGFVATSRRVFVCVLGRSDPRWSVGSYTVDVYINGEKVASDAFEIHD